MAGGIFGGGVGTKADPIIVEDAYDLNAIRNRIDVLNLHYAIVNDINLNVPPFNEGDGWKPIPYFEGVIDGRGHRIAGLISKSTSKAVGFITESRKRTQFIDLHFEDFYLEYISSATSMPAFTLLGTNLAEANIIGCSISGKVKLDVLNVLPENLNEGLLFRKAGVIISSGVVGITSDLLIDIESIGRTPVSILGEIGSFPGSSVEPLVDLQRAIIKSKGPVRLVRQKDKGRVVIEESYLIDSSDYEYPLFNESTPEGSSVEVERIEKKTSDFFNSASMFSYTTPYADTDTENSRVFWIVKEGSHPVMNFIGADRFLVKCEDTYYTLSESNVLEGTPTRADMFSAARDLGFRFLEEVPASEWAKLKGKNVEILCYSKKMPKKILSLSEVVLMDKGQLGDKKLLSTTIRFNEHNFDIVNITAKRGE